MGAVPLPCARLVGDEGFLEESRLKDKDRSFYLLYYPQYYLLHGFIQYRCCSTCLISKLKRDKSEDGWSTWLSRSLQPLLDADQPFSLQLPDQWEKAVITVSRPGKIPTGSRCGNTVPDDDNQVVSLPPGSRCV